ncbi:unnamed protein product [Arctia plantaginis]|uniref:MADF domain-containing protein n=1 Tax=Arctia plantaginis TaxID=874455 RepID=A0A8S1AR62_ARCPL|nr:unnamed protein product [Arctia plantaginis]
MSSWSNDETMAFLEAYQGEPCIWNPKDVSHKDKKKVADAWSQLSNTLKKPVKELKTKKEILMTTFRKHFKKKQDSIRSGAGTEDIYQPCWFAYHFMESFLMPVYACNYPLNTETDIESERNRLVLESADSANGSEHLNDPDYPLKRKRREVQETKSSAEKERTECEMYARLLVHKLMKLEGDDRLILMNKIDNLVFETTMEANANKKIKPNISNQILCNITDSSRCETSLCDIRSSPYQQSSPQELSTENYVILPTSSSTYSSSIVGNNSQCTPLIQKTEIKKET